MKVLIVDDDIVRLRMFSELFGHQEVLTASDCTEALQLLAQRPDLVSLDYDLNYGTTEPIAAEIAAGNLDVQLVIIHSDNPSGVQKLLAILPDSLAVPVTLLRSKSRLPSKLKALLSYPCDNSVIEKLKDVITAEILSE